MARAGKILPSWYLAEELGLRDPKEKEFAGQLLSALEKISADLTPRVLSHPLIHEIVRGPDAFKTLLDRYAKAADDGDRALALDALAEVLEHHRATHQVVVALEKILAETKSREVASVAARAVATAGSETFLEHQRNILGSKNPDEVRIAAKLVGWGKYKPAVPLLLDLLRPDNLIVADALIYALGAIGDETAVPLLHSWLSQLKMVEPIISALGKIGSRASVVRIVPFVLEGSREQREKAAEAISRIARKNNGSIGDPGLDDTVRKTLEKVLDSDESRLVRFYSIVSYALLGGRLEPARVLAALGGQLSRKEIDAVGSLLAPRAEPKDPKSKGPKPKKGRRGV